jgi:hypothetical protein
MSEARWREWLARTEETLRAPAGSRPDALAALAEQRGRLQRALEDDPATRPPPPPLAAQLRAAEQALAQALAHWRAALGEQAEAVRRARLATGGYRPARPDRAAFVSRSV